MAVLQPRYSEIAFDWPLDDFGPRIATPPASPAKIFSDTARRSFRNVSTQALRANQKADETLQQYAFVQKSAKGRASFDVGMLDLPGAGQSCSSRSVPSAALLATSKDREQTFHDDAFAVDVLIQSLASNLRLDSVKNQKMRDAEQLAKLREEQRRERAAEERFARQREAEARDPHKKVCMKIENTRKYNMEAVHEMGIPMTQVQFTGSGGIECVDMVDCSKIRQRCKQIDTGSTPSVRALVEEQARTDRLKGGKSKFRMAKTVSLGDLHSQQMTGKMSKSSPLLGACKRQDRMDVVRGSTPSPHRGLCDSAEQTAEMTRAAA